MLIRHIGSSAENITFLIKDCKRYSCGKKKAFCRYETVGCMVITDKARLSPGHGLGAADGIIKHFQEKF